jgi:beta-N-acetylhexosaminidase
MVARDVVEGFGQLFIMGFDGLHPSRETLEYLRTFRIGGVILFEDNYESVDQLRALTAQLQEHGAHPDALLFVCSDHEGGRVQRFRSGFTTLPAMAEVGRGSPAATEALHRRVARELWAAGVNLNLAPVADVCPSDQPGTIGDRSFGDDPVVVATHVAAAVRGLQAEGILACAKHFPGHGSTTQDAHRELPTIRSSLSDLEQRDLLPFKSAVAAEVGAVMTAHVIYPLAGDPDSPASLSAFWINQVLRHRLGFQGLILSDALEMKGIMTRYSPIDSGLGALAAGTDVLLYYKEADQYAAFYELRQALKAGDIDPEPVTTSLARVQRAKRRWLTG